MADILYKKHRVSLLVILTYFALCVGDHVWITSNYQSDERNAIGPLILHNSQRFCKTLPLNSPIHHLTIPLFQSPASTTFSSNGPAWKCPRSLIRFRRNYKDIKNLNSNSRRNTLHRPAQQQQSNKNNNNNRIVCFRKDVYFPFIVNFTIVTPVLP